VTKHDKQTIRAIPAVAGREVLTPQQVGKRLLAIEYRGRTIGEWATEAWADEEKPFHEAVRSPSGLLLRKIGLGASNLGCKYLHFYEVHRVLAALPELARWSGMLRGWEGVLPDGTPIPNSKPAAVQLSLVRNND